MRKQVLFLKSFMPYSWWIAILTSVGYGRLRLGRFEGIRHSWIWDNEDGILSHKVCERILEKEFFPFFERATRGVPQLLWDKPSLHPDYHPFSRIGAHKQKGILLQG